jgi:hypothetical protein
MMMMAVAATTMVGMIKVGSRIFSTDAPLRVPGSSL